MSGLDDIVVGTTCRFSKVLYLKAAKDYRDRIKWSDDILYEMCKGPPRHAKLDRVHGKLSLIGRSYATGLERLLKTDEKQSGNLRAWTDSFRCEAKVLDSIVTQVREERVPLKPGKIRRIAELHGQFAEVMQKRRGLRKAKGSTEKLTPTSFVSKYLHFHNPAVPIYDSWAAAGARRVACLRACDEQSLQERPSGADPDYWQFLRRFWCVYQEAHKVLRHWPSVRYLDRYFLEVQGAARRPKKSR